MGWGFLGIICAVCAVCCACGFKKFVWFLSIGYGFAIAGGGITILILTLANGWGGAATWLAVLQALLFVAYGARLSGFLLYRELKNKAYVKTLNEDAGGDKKMPIFVLAAIWVFVSVLYTAQVSPMFFRYYNVGTGVKAAHDYVLPIIGMLISVLGLCVEALADKQKSDQKKVNPKMVATQGLYKLVRCPNYLGEITFWIGVFVAGITAFKTVGQWIMAILALIAIVFIMFNGAQRLEKRQNERYGNNKTYLEYANSTPIILPFIPLYHLNKPEKKVK
ncbi:MAG: DUF1295 domain-containing protein [Clostridia bacterium]|nr:DUF1295 domain-containing protein [Clostridia bacterium]